MNIAEPSNVSTNAEMNLSTKIYNARVQSAPFAYAFVRNVFPQMYYDLMRKNFPDPTQLVSNGQAGRGDKLQARFVFELKPEYLNTLPAMHRDFWSDFANWILGERLRKHILQKFAWAVGNRFRDREHIEFWSDAALVEDRTTHSMGPHTDHPRKAVTLLFYLPGDESQAHLGTTIYLPKDRTFNCSGLAHHRSEDFDRVETFPFVPNALVMFAKSDNSFHGVEPVNDLSCRRWLLMLNINVRDLR
ncbi:MAG TPA: hypothetical protein VHQ01_12140 [Pyrinomonadaceae bacterium]|jgi:hypothetical protein|nr:hypothetical protein [Pyrinomonadaceae bacterium]